MRTETSGDGSIIKKYIPCKYRYKKGYKNRGSCTVLEDKEIKELRVKQRNNPNGPDKCIDPMNRCRQGRKYPFGCTKNKKKKTLSEEEEKKREGDQNEYKSVCPSEGYQRNNCNRKSSLTELNIEKTKYDDCIRQREAYANAYMEKDEADQPLSDDGHDHYEETIANHAERCQEKIDNHKLAKYVGEQQVLVQGVYAPYNIYAGNVLYGTLVSAHLDYNGNFKWVLNDIRYYDAITRKWVRPYFAWDEGATKTNEGRQDNILDFIKEGNPIYDSY